MPITTTIQIIITLAGPVERGPPLRPLLAHQAIHLWEMPAAEYSTFTWRVSEGDTIREAQLSTAESRELATLLKQLPAHSMISEGRSFDGITYELIVRQAKQSLSFHWQNDDWRYASPNLLNKWENVAAVADYCLSLTRRKKCSPPANKPQKSGN